MLSCSTAQLLDAVAQANPQLGTLIGLLNAPSAQQICPQSTRAAGERRRPVVKDAPSFGKIAAMVLFALSCFGLLLFLWLAFGGPVPLKPKGYRFHTSFAEAGQLALEADVRISGVPVGKVKTITPDKHTGALGRRDPAAVALRAAAVGRARDPAPEDAAGRDLRRADAGAQLGASRSPRAARWPPRRSRTRSSSTRSCARSTRKTRAAFQDWMQTQAQAISNRGRDLNDALGNLGPFAEDTADIVAILNRQEGALSRLVANTGDRLRRADRARRRSCAR